MNALLMLLISAQVYTWTDKAGLQHFSDSLESVPRGVKVRTTEGEIVSSIKSDAVKKASTVATAPQVPNSLETEFAWRRVFREANDRISMLEAEVEADRLKVEELNGLPVSMGFTCGTGWWNGGRMVTPTRFGSPCVYSFNPEWERIRERLASNRLALVRARDDLQELERRASFASVPREWRR